LNYFQLPVVPRAMSVVAIVFSEDMRGLPAAPALPKSVRSLTEFVSLTDNPGGGLIYRLSSGASKVRL
jgi:hypothetical protein